jgi:hypothetical protein
MYSPSAPPYPLVLTGGYAVRAHQLVSRPSQDLDVATGSPAPMAHIAAALSTGLQWRGWQVQALETAPLSARFTVSDPATGQECEVDILKEIFWRPVTDSPYGPVLAEEDVIGTNVRALGDRGAPRDLIEVFGASRRWNTTDLEEFGRRPPISGGIRTRLLPQSTRCLTAVSRAMLGGRVTICCRSCVPSRSGPCAADAPAGRCRPAGAGPPPAQPHIRDLSTSTSQPGANGSKPCPASQRTTSRLRSDHHARITSRSTSLP